MPQEPLVRGGDGASDPNSRRIYSSPVTGTQPETGRRADIQGLRAVAVLLVIAYHAGLPIPGGYLGVDMFFVISGYVITQLLVRELSTTGRIDLPRFYLRRAKRLLPALGLMVGATSVVSLLLLSPMGMQQNAAKTGLGALALSANWVISHTTGGYFDLPAQQNPLLHTWSLSVEEQFYLWFPLAAFAAWRQRRIAGLVAVSAAAGLLSLAVMATVGQAAAPSLLTWATGFYGPIARIFQFTAGALGFVFASTPRLRTSPVKLRSLTPRIWSPVAWAGLAWAVAVHTVGNTSSVALRLLTTAATVLLLLPQEAPSIDRAWLSSRAMRSIGDKSYSLYLWHWPLIAISVYLWPLSDLAPGIAAACSVPVAYVSFVWVEEPLRRVATLSRRQWSLVAAAYLAVPLFAAAGLGYLSSSVWFPRYESGMIIGQRTGDIGASTFADFSGRNTRNCATDPSSNVASIEQSCLDAGAAGMPNVLVLGDSHAGHLLPGLAATLPDLTFRLMYTNMLRESDSVQTSRLVEQVAKMPELRVVLLNAYWARSAEFGPRLRSFVKALSDLGKRVIVLDDVPDFPFDSFACKYGVSPLIAITRCDEPRSTFDRRYHSYVAELHIATRGIAHVSLLKTAHSFCSSSVCSMTDGRRVLYLDANRLNVQGSLRIARTIEAAIRAELD